MCIFNKKSLFFLIIPIIFSRNVFSQAPANDDADFNFADEPMESIVIPDMSLIDTDETENALAVEEELSAEKALATDEKASATEKALATDEKALPAEKALATNEKASSAEKALATDEKALVKDEALAVNEASSEKPQKIELPFEGMDRPEVEKFRKMYLSPKWAKHLCSYLEKSLTYRLYVRKSIADRQMPEILEYLPVVESNYKTNAKSSSGAIGLWQFMANSVEPFLVLNDYVDERYDPWKSTDAALRKLTDNYNFFKDWLIAIGAYNCGMGAMNRALKKSDVKSFWALVDKGLIPNQTANYVPKLLAIADLAINSEYYGLDIPNHNEEYETLYNERNGIFDYVTVTKAYSIAQIAREMRIDATMLKELNPSYIMGFTHPSKESQIRLPSGMAHTAEEAIKKISPIDFPFKYKVEAGDSLWSISRKYGVTIDAICELNGIKENAILRIGKILYIPSK